MTKTIKFLTAYKWAIFLLLIALFTFYWYELRPIVVYRSCAIQSSADARALLANKAEISRGTPQGNTYQQLLEKNLYLRSDYESFLMKCLLRQGYQITPIENEPPAEAVDTENE